MDKPRVRVAIVGTGHWGPNLLRNFMEDPRVEVTAVCDLDAKKLEPLARRYRGLPTTSDLASVTDDPKLDAAIICTPTNTHYTIAKAFLAKGKHVFLEKPMATRSDECEKLIEEAERRRLKLMVGHVFLFNPAIRHLRALLEKEELGELLYVYGTRVNLGPIRQDVSALWDLAPHDIAIYNYLLGATPLSVHATGTARVNPPLHDVVFVTLKYPGGILVNLHAGWLDPRKIRQTTVVGTKRMVLFDDLDPIGPIHVYEKNVTRRDPEPALADTIHGYKIMIQDGDIRVPKIPLSEPLRNECSEFVGWLAGGPQPLSTGADGLAVVRVLEAADKSLANGGAEVPILSAPAARPPRESARRVA